MGPSVGGAGSTASGSGSNSGSKSGSGSHTGGGFTRRRPTTGGGDGATTADEYFTPGQDGNLTWNTTQPIAEKPILLYVFNGHVSDGVQFDYSKAVELGMFKNKELIKEARGFVCEKICVSDHEFLRKVKGREPVNAFLAASMEKNEQRKVQLMFLDSQGKLISIFNEPKSMKEGAPALLREIKKAREENARRLAAAVPQSV